MSKFQKRTWCCPRKKVCILQRFDSDQFEHTHRKTCTHNDPSKHIVYPLEILRWHSQTHLCKTNNKRKSPAPVVDIGHLVVFIPSSLNFLLYIDCQISKLPYLQLTFLSSPPKLQGHIWQPFYTVGSIVSTACTFIFGFKQITDFRLFSTHYFPPIALIKSCPFQPLWITESPTPKYPSDLVILVLSAKANISRAFGFHPLSN